ncbi:MAG: zinc-binding alcohol dehydrogenase family protein [Negativicutes bacterium]
MKSIVLMKAKVLEIQDHPIPKIANPDDVLIRVKAVGICGSDIHAYDGSLTTIKYPRTIGHEVVGEVSAVGDAVTHVKPGDHVAMDPVVSCGACLPCRNGRRNVCRDVKCMGVAAEGGAAEYIILPAHNVVKMPPDIPWREAVLAEPFTIGANATAQARVVPGDMALVMGAGTIGLVAMQAAKLRGACVMIADIVDSRLKLAAKLGADRVVNTKTEDLTAAVSEFTKGEGVTVFIDAVGVPALLVLGTELTAPTGRIVALGLTGDLLTLPQAAISKKELELIGSRMHSNRFPEVINWINEKKVHTDPMVTHSFSFTQAQAAFDLIEKSPQTTCKVILTFD